MEDFDITKLSAETILGLTFAGTLASPAMSAGAFAMTILRETAAQALEHRRHEMSRYLAANATAEELAAAVSSVETRIMAAEPAPTPEGGARG